MSKTPDFKSNKSFVDLLKKDHCPLPETGWNYVGPSEEHGINFLSGWGNSSSTTVPASWYLSDDGEVRLRGKITGGDTDTIIFTLPEEVRPEFTERYIIPIEDDVHLENIRFRAFLDGTGIPEFSGVFLAGGSGGDDDITEILFSTDGLSWIARPSPWDAKTGYVYTFTKSDSLYIAMGQAPETHGDYTHPIKRIMTSPDTITWTERDTPWDASPGQPSDMFTPYYYPVPVAGAYAEAWDTVYITALGTPSAPNPLIQSTDGGITWELVDSNPQAYNESWYIFYVPFLQRLYLSGFSPSGENYFMYYTTDGSTWNPVTTPVDDSGNAWGVGNHCIANGKVYLVVFGADNNIYVINSSDGDTWEANIALDYATYGFIDVDFGNHIGLAYNQQIGKFALTTTNSGTPIFISDDGVSWGTTSAFDANVIFEDLTASNNLFVGAGYNDGGDDVILKSSDGVTWDNVSSPWSGTNPEVNGIKYFPND